MRTILLLIALLIVIAMALVWTGFINLNRNANGSVSIETKDGRGRHDQAPTSRCRWCETETRQVEVPSVAVTERPVQRPITAFPLPEPMRLALDEAAAAARDGEVPVGAVVTRGGEVLARGAQPDARPTTTRPPMPRWWRCARPRRRSATAGSTAATCG